MDRRNKTTITCSVCNGQKYVNVLYLQKKCLFCNDEYHNVRLENTIYRYSYCITPCPFCKSVCVLESMETCTITCPLCMGTGTRTWIDKMVRPYKKKRFEEYIYNIVVESCKEKQTNAQERIMEKIINKNK